MTADILVIASVPASGAWLSLSSVNLVEDYHRVPFTESGGAGGDWIPRQAEGTIARQGDAQLQLQRNKGGGGMNETGGTVRLHRVLRAPAARVYKAFLDPDAMAKWLPPHGFTGRVHHMDARVGGGYKMSFTNFGTGSSHSFGGTYEELVPGERIRYTDRFDDPGLPGEMRVTIHLREVSCGTEVEITQAGIPPAIPLEFCYLGWQESLGLLAQVVEPNIPDGA